MGLVCLLERIRYDTLIVYNSPGFGLEFGFEFEMVCCLSVYIYVCMYVLGRRRSCRS